MKILFVTQWFDPEPGALRGLPLARYLMRAGEEVQVLTGFPNYPGGKLYPGYKMRMWQRETIEGVPVLRVPLYASHDNSGLRRALNYSSFALSAATIGTCLSGPADVVYVYHPPPTVALPGIVIKTLRQIPSVYHIADMWPESVIESGMIPKGRAGLLAAAALSAWCHFAYRHSDRITVLSPGFKRLLIERGVAESKIHVIYNWADEDAFRPAERDGRMGRQVGLSDTFNVVYAVNLGPFQGLDTLIRAAARLEDIARLRIVIVGTGQKAAELKELAESLRLNNVVFMGRREYWEMPEVYALADVLLVHLRDLPFFAATIPSKTQVSMCCGRPCLMAVRGDAADLILKADAGLACEPENPDAMAQTIRQFCDLPKARLEQMGRNGRDYYLREMSLASGAERMRELFRSAARRPGEGSV
ncbi:MAG: glycosyltransferase family 4 protein [Acidobacteriota bacterium]|nr:glycosyltransferase family 4 protein [Acidobacteriota bacterium]